MAALGEHSLIYFDSLCLVLTMWAFSALSLLCVGRVGEYHVAETEYASLPCLV